MVNLLVYGTLKRDGSRQGRMGRSRFIREVLLDGFDMYRVPSGDYPAIVPGAGRIHAELFTVDEATLRSLDVTEGFHGKGHVSNLYDRIEVTTTTGETGWIYVASAGLARGIVSPENKIESGNWNVHER